MGEFAFVAIAVFVLVVIVVVAMLARPRVQPRLFSGTGIDGWRRKASDLPWRDRWRLYWANSWGLAVPLRLAPLAVERGEVMLAMTNRMRTKGSGIRRFWQGLGIVWIVLLGLNIGLLAAGQLDSWINFVAPVLGLLTVFVAIGAPQSWQARLIQRSIERNQEQLSKGE